MYVPAIVTWARDSNRDAMAIQPGLWTVKAHSVEVVDEELPSPSDRPARRARVPVLGSAELPPAGLCTSGGLLQPCERVLSIAQCHDNWVVFGLSGALPENDPGVVSRQCGRGRSGQDPERSGEVFQEFWMPTYLMRAWVSTRTIGRHPGRRIADRGIPRCGSASLSTFTVRHALGRMPRSFF